MPINYKDYPPDWPERRERILLRAWYCCEFCGLPDGALIVRSKHRPHLYRLPFRHEISEMLHYMHDKGFPKKNACRRAGLIWIVLTIAHLDRDAHNWEVSDDRLAALCQRCHLAYDAQHNANKRRARHTKTWVQEMKQLELPFDAFVNAAAQDAALREAIETKLQEIWNR